MIVEDYFIYKIDGVRKMILNNRDRIPAWLYQKAEGIADYYEENAIPVNSFARCVAFAISQPEKADVNEILFRPTRQ